MSSRSSCLLDPFAASVAIAPEPRIPQCALRISHLKVAFLTPSLSRSAGGIFEIERRLAQSLSGLPITQVEVFGPEDEYTSQDLPAWWPLEPHVFPSAGPASFGYSKSLCHAYLSQQCDLGHLHALWMYNSVVMSRWARLWRTPYMITANGMLESWALKNSPWKKRLALLLYERKCLDGAACLQVNSQAELRSVRAFGLRNPVCIIPNGVDLPLLVESSELIVDSPLRGLKADGRKVLLYLGRIHPKKGLVNLLRAWKTILCSHTSTLNWVLAVAGWSQGAHEQELRTLAAECGIEDSLVFLGPQFGEAKAACYRDCDAFILPSFSEGLPMAVLEAWSYGKPVLMTPECNLPEGFATEAAVRIGTDVESIQQALEDLFRTSHSALRAMGENGHALVAERFTWPKVAREMRAVYEWVLGGSARPGCVTT